MAIIPRVDREGKTRYFVRVRDRCGRFYPSRTFDNKSLASRYERSLLTQRDRGTVSPCEIERKLTFQEYWGTWSIECRTNVSEGWKMSQDQMARDYLLPVLGNMRLREIKSQDVGKVLNRHLESGLSPQTVLHLYNILHKAFSDAIEHYELLDTSPVRKRYRPRVPRRERNFLSPADSWKLLNVVRDHVYGPAIWISVLAGLRPGEVQALTWSAVDFERSQILIRATYIKKTRKLQPYPKQEDWGVAPMPLPLADYLRERKGSTSSIYVAPNRKGGIHDYIVLLEVLERFCKVAGVRRVTPHELRHSATELYVQAGASAEDIRRLLNQKSLNATRRYMHRTDERLASIASRIEIAP